MASLSTKHLLGIADLSTEDIQLIHSTADEFKEVLSRKIKKVMQKKMLMDDDRIFIAGASGTVSYTHLRAHETS